ncbi:hypothetical protein E2P81_ATG00710 [Venturia nashicola]|nr:hypothetical protein E2P81_ATG00710 [Venturia nashicola]
MQGELQKARQDVTRLSLGNAALTTTAEQSAEALDKLKEAHLNTQSKLRSAEYQITEFIRENGTLTTAAHESRRKLQIEELEVGRLRAEALEVQQNAKKTKVDYDSLQEKYTDLQRDHIVADNKAKSYFGTVGRLHTQIIRVSKENNSLKDQVEKLEEKLDDLPLSCQTRCCTLYGKSQQVDSSSVQVELQDTKKKLQTTKDLLQKSEVAKSSLHDWIVKYRNQITALKKDKQIVQGKRAAAEKRAGKWKKKLNEKPRTRKATAGLRRRRRQL